MEKELDQAVRVRAGDACEYCLMPQAIRRLRFQIDHIIARQHGGKTIASNLALCCGRCNLHKGPNLAGIDQDRGQMVRLFHPRIDLWREHFRWDGPRIVGLTAEKGRATIDVLAMNHPDDVAVRDEMIVRGVFPT
jgi:hypothetical protein